MSRTVSVVPHSHWDREWYAPFESYRVRLVSMMDGLLDLLESGETIEHFHLDGQTALVDDYLEAHPSARCRLERLVAAGRVAVGPWYVLMDEFCVSAETIVRNLQLGLARASAVGAGQPGAAAPVGYLPDMFGHVAQMPQVLNQAGIAHAVVWRGVPASLDRRAFWWDGPDGSRVRAEYLPVGYAAGAFLPKDADALVRRMAAHEREISSFIGTDGDILLMNGGDHQEPQAWLADLLSAANRQQEHFRFRQSRLADFLHSQPTDGLQAWCGELRSGARAPILMGVLSNRVDVKQAAAAAETALEKVAEPLAALWQPPDLWPGELLDRAWLEMIRNSAHDSVCACSADPVVRAVRQRYDTAVTIADEVRGSALAIAGVATAAAGHVVVNSLPTARGGVVELDLPGVEAPAGAQQLQVTPAAVEERHGRGRDLGRLLGELARDGWLGRAGRGVDARLEVGAAGGGSGGGGPGGGGPVRVTIVEDSSRTPEPAMAPVMAEAWAQAGAGRDEPLTVRVERAAAQRVAVRVEDVPGWGWAVWEAGGRAAPSPPAVTAESAVTARSAGAAVEVGNGLVHVRIDRADGTFSLDGIPGHNLIVEESDEGDTYNFSPTPGRAAITKPTHVELEVVEHGPVRARVAVRRRYPWDPETEVLSELELCAGETAVRVTTSFDHRGRDHRIRAVFPLGTGAASTEAECAFATVVRAKAEGGAQEPALATFPSRRFVRAGPTTVFHQGLLEYELVDGGTALAVTLLRATGILSRPAPPARPNVAGPALELRDAQMPGPQTFRYAVARDCADPWTTADCLWTPLLPVRAGGHGHLPDRGSRLQLSGAKVSALHRRDGAIEVRVFNPAPSPTEVRIPGHRGTLVDLRGVEVGAWEDGFELRPWAFATARLAAVSLD